MRWTKEELERQFTCPKCRHRGALVQEVQLGRSVAHVLPLPPTRYWAASCGLCGYTELYHLAILEKCGEEAFQPVSKLAEKPE
jgi:predicted nucleic-acid-binding Zn-ribbon protein